MKKMIALLAVMLLFQLCRRGFYLFNTGSFPATTPLSLLKAMAGGTVFDLTAVLYTNSLYIVMQMLPFRFRERRGYQLASKWVFAVTNSVALLANVADSKSLVIHPASTTHAQLTPQEQAIQEIFPGTIRLSIGTEHIDDLLADLKQALEAV